MAVGRHQAHLTLSPRMNSAPFRKYRVSSPVIANCVFATISFTAARGSVALVAPLASGTAGKSSLRQRLHARVETIGGHLHAVLVFGDAHVGFRQRLHDLVKFFRRQRQRSAFLDGRIASAAKRDFEIGCQHANLIALGFHQHVRQNRNRVFPFDDALEKLQFSQ